MMIPSQKTTFSRMLLVYIFATNSYQKNIEIITKFEIYETSSVLVLDLLFNLFNNSHKVMRELHKEILCLRDETAGVNYYFQLQMKLVHFPISDVTIISYLIKFT